MRGCPQFNSKLWSHHLFVLYRISVFSFKILFKYEVTESVLAMTVNIMIAFSLTAHDVEVIGFILCKLVRSVDSLPIFMHLMQ